MTAAKKNPASVDSNGFPRHAPAIPLANQPSQFSTEQLKALIAELEVPFDPALIEWRVANVTEDKSRGQIMPYADPRAYMDRLNELFTPAGWTRKYIVNTSANFERSEDQKVVAKVFVIGELTIYGVNSHAATGEEWTDNPNAGTSAEAQAFKRACACFGLGRYLYSFGSIWVDLDGRGRPREAPQVQGWATPEGWRSGLRPSQEGSYAKPAEHKRRLSSKKLALLQQIEAMAEPLGKTLYRGVLKDTARVWNPADIRETRVLEKVLTIMRSAEHNLGLLEAAVSKIEPEALELLLRPYKVKSVGQLDSLDMLQKLVTSAEEKASQTESV